MSEVDCESLLGAIDELLDVLLDVESSVGEPAADYCGSVRSQAEDMAEWIRENDRATENQQRAVTNWTEGASKWLRDF